MVSCMYRPTTDQLIEEISFKIFIGSGHLSIALSIIASVIFFAPR